MTVENIQEIPVANYNTEIGTDYVKFTKIGNGVEATLHISDFSRTGVHISLGSGFIAVGTTDLSDLEANGYSEEDPIEGGGLEIQDGNVEVISNNPSVPSQQYNMSELDVAVKILDGTMTAFTKAT